MNQDTDTTQTETASATNKQTQIVGDGQPGPGRPVGSKNLMTRSAREIALNLLRTNAEEAQRQLDALKKYPRVWLTFYLRIGRLLIPRTSRDDSAPLVNINMGAASVAPGDAERTYLEMCRAVGQVRHTAPALSTAEIERPVLEHQPDEVVP